MQPSGRRGQQGQQSESRETGGPRTQPSNAGKFTHISEYKHLLCKTDDLSSVSNMQYTGMQTTHMHGDTQCLVSITTALLLYVQSIRNSRRPASTKQERTEPQARPDFCTCTTPTPPRALHTCTHAHHHMHSPPHLHTTTHKQNLKRYLLVKIRQLLRCDGSTWLRQEDPKFQAWVANSIGPRKQSNSMFKTNKQTNPIKLGMLWNMTLRCVTIVCAVMQICATFFYVSFV